MDIAVFVTVYGRRSFTRVVSVAYRNGAYRVVYRVSDEGTTVSAAEIRLEDVIAFEVM